MVLQSEIEVMREEIKMLRLKNFELEKGFTELKVTKEVMEK